MKTLLSLETGEQMVEGEKVITKNGKVCIIELIDTFHNEVWVSFNGGALSRKVKPELLNMVFSEV